MPHCQNLLTSTKTLPESGPNSLILLAWLEFHSQGMVPQVICNEELNKCPLLSELCIDKEGLKNNTRYLLEFHPQLRNIGIYDLQCPP